MIPEHTLLTFKEKLHTTLVTLGFPEKNVLSIVKSIVLKNFENDTLTLVCTNPIYTMLVEEKHDELLAIVQSIWGMQARYILQAKNDKQAKAPTFPVLEKPKNTSLPPSLFDFDTSEKSISHKNTIQKTPHDNFDKLDPNDFGLNPDFTFSAFVKGPSNSIAFSACESVSLQPGKLSNPVFIYGGSGLGKTHLLHAIGNRILFEHPSWKVLYLPSHDFVSSFVQAIRHGQGNNFRTRFLECDVLLVDDVQFLENKEQTQLEFFHIFNLLCQKRKQVVLTSDKYPKDIPTLEERLRSRFLQGLLADIEPPSYEERLAIIESTAEKLSLRLSQDIASLIATNVKTNIRELKGTLNNLYLRQTVSGVPPTTQDVETVLRSIVKIQRQVLDIPTIQKIVANFYDIKITDLTSSSKTQKLVFPRHVAMYLAREVLNSNLIEIANAFGRKDHTTVLNAYENVKKKMELDASTRSTISEIRRRLEQIG